MSDLHERVARMMAEMRQKELDVDFGGFDGYTDEGKQTALAEAAAVIPMILEDAAKVADPPLMHRKGKPGLWRTRRAAIAAAIRALSEAGK